MDYYGLMLLFLRFKAALLACPIVILGMSAVLAQSVPTEALSRTVQQEANTAIAATPSALDADLFYELLLGEMMTAHGDFATAYTLLLDVARRIGDEELFRRAADVAMESRVDKYALFVISAWLQALPQSRDANLYMLRSLVMLNRVLDTAGPIQLELSRGSTEQKISTLHALPHLFAHVSDKAEAAQMLERTFANHLTDPDIGAIAWITLGRMRLAAENPSGAMQALRNAHALDASNESVARLGLELMEAKVDGAELLLKAYLNGMAHPQLRIAYARLLVQSNRFDEARTQVQAVTDKHPNALEAWLMLSALHLENRQLDAAQQTLEKFNKEFSTLPEDEQPQEALAQMYLMQAKIVEQRGDFLLAEHWLERIPDISEFWEAQRLRITLLVKQDKQEQAQALIRRIAAKLEQRPYNRLRVEAQLLREEGLYGPAYVALARALALLPKGSEDSDDVKYELAMMAEKLGRTNEMERLLREIISGNPKAAHALNALGFSFADRGIRLQEAKTLITRALNLAPEDPFITDSLGWVEFRLGNTQEALRLLQFAFEKRPHAEIAAHLGEIWWLQGERERALSIWRKGMELDEKDSALQDTLKRLGIEL